MKNLPNQKNKLKDLIYIQGNKPCDEQTIKGLFRAIVEPVLDRKAEGLVLFRLGEKSKKSFEGLLKRFEYSLAETYDFSTTPISENIENILKENIWGSTEFVYVLTKRYGVSFIFDYAVAALDGFAGTYTLFNSKFLNDTFDIINANSLTNLSAFNENLHPERRDNDVLNASIQKLVEILNETNQEMMISELQKEDVEETGDLASRLDFISNKSRYVAHEIRNQLSICDLYSSIIEKQIKKLGLENEITEKSMLNALSCIQKSLRVASTELVDLKSLNNNDLKKYNLNELIETSIELSKVYSNGKDISISYEKTTDEKVMVDESKFLAALINIIKNAVESIEETGNINIKSEVVEEEISIVISNNGAPIQEDLKEKIFEDRFSTKTSGSGVGLFICKKSLEEQYANLKLKKSDEVSTEFEITLPKI